MCSNLCLKTPFSDSSDLNFFRGKLGTFRVNTFLKTSQLWKRGAKSTAVQYFLLINVEYWRVQTSTGNYNILCNFINYVHACKYRHVFYINFKWSGTKDMTGWQNATIIITNFRMKNSIRIIYFSFFGIKMA